MQEINKNMLRLKTDLQEAIKESVAKGYPNIWRRLALMTTPKIQLPNMFLTLDDLNKNTEKKSKLTKHVLQFKSRYVTNNKTVAIPQNAIGFLINDTNNVEASAKGVYLMSSPITRHIKTYGLKRSKRLERSA